MASKQLELVQRMEEEAWARLLKAAEKYGKGEKYGKDERVLRLWDRWSAISDVLDELKEMEGGLDSP